MKSKFTPLPFLLTSGNLFCGFLSIILAVNDALKLVKYEYISGGMSFRPFEKSAWLILLAMVFDLLDGMVARLTKTDSVFGKEYDSLADLLSFGVAPAIILYLSVLRYQGHHGEWGWFFASAYVLCGALRLARFNSKSSLDTNNFTGLPIPAAAGILVSYVLFSLWADLYYVEKSKIVLDNAVGWYKENINTFQQIVIPALMIFLALLMISNIKFPAFKSYTKKGRAPLILLAIGLVFLLISLINPEPAIFTVCSLYLLGGLAKAGYDVFSHRRKKESL